MWTKILKEKNLVVSYVDFLKKGLLIIPTVFSMTLITLYFIVN
jgi:Na+/H+ antiporter NhaD/arsenite permease-like protein